MRKTYGKNSLRTVKQTAGRFAAIFAIVALGVGFLVGLMSSTPDMRYSFDKYFDENSLYDIRVLGDLGLTNSDITKLRELEGVESVQAGYIADVSVTSSKSVDFTARMHSLNLNSDTVLNRPTLTSGRFPLNSNECVVVNVQLSPKSKLDLGDTLKVSDSDKSTTEVLSVKEYTVVGFADYCQYFSAEKEYTNIGSGTVDIFLLVPNESFATDFYTDVYITATGAKELTSLTSQYQSLVDETAASIESIADERCEIRYNEVLDQALAKMKQAQAAYAAASNGSSSSLSPATSSLPKIDVPNWHIYTREDNISYYSITESIDKVNAIAKVFPFFFFLVAALVALTTMTRMVEDERLQIGTMKALGYSTGAIMWKYILYALSASVLGCIVGVAVGFRLFPTVIWNAYTMMYELPNFYCPINWMFAAITSGAAILCTLLATINACRATLKEKPAQLMLMKAPEAGKRVLLERITPIWSRMSFTRKVTARNLFRYKKRFLMTTIGVAGCTALVLTGFGLRDSFSDIADRQFGVLNTYDIMAPVANEENFSNTELQALLNEADKISGYMEICYESVKTSNGSNSIDLYTFVSENTSDLDGYVNFQNRKSGKTLAFEEGSVIITERASEILKVKVGDSITVTDKKGNIGTFTITGINENYIRNYLYMSRSTYKEGMGQNAAMNMLLIRLTDVGLNAKTNIGRSLLGTGAVSGISYTSIAKEAIALALSKIGTIVAVVILSAGALAFVVLYNLTNINISERVKEIATIKVLGFTDREVYSYINRESLLLSIIGTAFGLVLGIFLHRYVMGSAEMPSMMFGRSVRAISFIYSALLTIAFSVLVDLIMRRKLRNISMVESMKAPE